MKLTKQQIEDARSAYELYWKSYLTGDIETIAALLVEEYTQIGSVENEVFFNKKDAVQFIVDTIDQVAGNLEMLNRITKSEPIDRLILFHEECDLYVLGDEGWFFYSRFRASSLMKEQKDGWKMIHQHSSLPDSKTKEGENIAIEKISEENLQLRDAVKRRTAELENKNRELEIEAALEKVRAAAMSMRTPEELQLVGEVIFDELKALGFSNLRNTEIVINRDEKQSILSYYYSDYGVSGLIEVGYTSHPKLKKWAEDLKTADDGFAAVHISEKELDEWKNFREELGYLPDPKLEESNTLDYYSYSTGLGALSISSFKPISSEQLTTLERFRNVFGLAYRRYADVAQAEAQAREVEKELALERVRARTMAMQHSDELIETSELMFEQIKSLGIELWSCGFSLWYDDDSYFMGYNPGPDGKMGEPLKIPLTEDVFFTTIRDAKRRGEEFLLFESEGESLRQTYRYMDNLPVVGENMRGIVEAGYPLPTYQVTHCGFFSEGHLMFITQEPNPEAVDIFKRFTKVFDQTYTRFLDLQKAEAQVREAQIEAALERVRSRSLAMHHSDELAEASQVLDQQVRALGIETWGCAFHIYADDPEGDYEWFSSREGSLPFYKTPREKFFLTFYEKGQAGEAFHVEEFLRENCKAHYEYLMTLPMIGDALAEIVDAGGSLPDSQYDHVAFFKHGYVLFITYEPVPEAHDIFKRFAKVFEQTYTRFLDLQKAEEQAREAQIEAALERVRSKSLAMHHSSELSAVVDTLLQEFTQLEFTLTFCIINLIDGDDQSNTVWAANPETGKDAESYYMKFEDYDFHRAMWNAWKAQDKRFVYTLEGEEKKIYDEYLYSETEFRRFPKHVQEANKALDRYVAGFTFFKYSGLQTVSENEITEAELEILERFGKVFEQAYTRFLDLQKAEAQAREAQIEAALERVRSRSLAMQKSNEMHQVINIVSEQLTALEIEFDTANFIEINEDGNWELWVAAPGQDYAPKIHVPYNDNPIMNELLDAKKKGVVFYQNVFNFDDKNEFYTHFFENTAGRNASEERKQFVFKGEAISISSFTAKSPALSISKYRDEPFTEDESEIFRRFANVFEQAYTRFLDLKKAEAQTREAKIETALEKVRSRTMGMRSSDELPEVANLLFLEVQALSIPAWSCGYCILLEDRKSSTCIMSSEGTLQKPFLLPHTGEPSFEEWDDFVHSDETFFTQELGGEAIDSHYNFMKSLPQLTPIIKEIEEAGLSLPTYQINHLCKFSNGFMLFITYETVPDAHDIFLRFTKVFDQTYTRFLDLQKAEAQTREAQIGNALEKVRSRSLAMQSPDELVEVAQLLREEMGALGVEELETSSIFILDDSSGKTQCWFTIKDADNPVKSVSDRITINLQDTWVGRQMDEFYSSGQDITSVLTKGDHRIEWFRYVEQNSDLLEKSEFFEGTIPERVIHLCKFSNGFLGAASPGDISDESWDLMKRATGVFSFAYTRFRDLQKAEESARRSRQQASLDRVRADISSMRSADDLNRVTPLVWSELTTLGIPFIRCGVFIIHEEEKEVEVYLSKPDGTSLAVMHLPFGSSELATQTVNAWKAGRVLKMHWTREEFLEWGQSMMEQGQVPDLETYRGSEEAPESLHLHFIPFNQGMLYVGSTGPLDNEEISLSESLAKAFSIAYARYEDFVKLEKAKAGIEDALTELKATQSQLIQQEKLASLGQLTAGIAHEIKNPLNFVNNFSELSVELIEEARDEVRVMNLKLKIKNSELSDILNDIEANLKTIHKHGSRADSIVKSMLQHSRGGDGKMEPTNLNSLTKEYVNLAFHGMRAGKQPINVDINLDLDEQIGEIPLVAEDFSRVILNLTNNAFDAMREKMTGDGGPETGYQPKLTVRTHRKDTTITIEIEDNGPGIPEEMKDKILQPFFTTKKGTAGTGLGLSITNDIIKAHRGELEIESKPGALTCFILKLPSA